MSKPAFGRRFMSEKLLVEGGIPLKGHFPVSGAKNSSLKMMVAALLTSEPVVLQNVPRISDVEDLLECLNFLGAQALWSGPHEITIEARKIKTKALPVELAAKNRSTFLIFGALLARFGRAVLPDPGGDKIGRRPVNRHIEGFKMLGIKISREGDYFSGRGQIIGGSFRFAKNSHTGTENLLISASLSSGQTILENAAEEPEVDNLIEMLKGMGAKIKRKGPRTIEIEGVAKLSGTIAKVIPDRIEAATAAILAAATGGDLTIAPVIPADLTAFLSKLKAIGVSYQVSGEQLQVWSQPEVKLQPVEIESRPHPGFMTDWIPPFAVLLTQADGISTVHETIYANRFQYVSDLQKMGAEIQFFHPAVDHSSKFSNLSEAKISSSIYNFDPQEDREEFFHAIKIFGPTPLSGTKLIMPDIRAAACLVVAALSARGQSEIVGIEHLDRGYENFVGKVKELGAKIERVDSPCFS